MPKLRPGLGHFLCSAKAAARFREKKTKCDKIGMPVDSLPSIMNATTQEKKVTRLKVIQQNTRLPTYLPYPRFLSRLPLGDTARLVYTHLLGRIQLSQQSGWADEFGVYVFYPITELAKDCGKCDMTIKTALADLQKANLILRRHQGVGKANKIYLKIPETENCPPRRQSAVRLMDSPLSGSNRKEILDNRYTFQEGESL